VTSTSHSLEKLSAKMNVNTMNKDKKKIKLNFFLILKLFFGDSVEPD